MGKKNTFWKLIQENRIEIPVIQREYAQGRNEERIEALRKSFIADILKSIIEEKEFLHLGFIYGKIEGKDKYHERIRNKKAIENILNAVEGYAQHLDMRIETKIDALVDTKSDVSNLPTFIPLDGQQRLTTLFLIHWYLSLFYNQDTKEILSVLRRFTYKTRKSSFEFCRAITSEEVYSEFTDLDKNQISDFILKRKWFRKNWLKDATVKGMLTMLDEINFQFKNIDNKAQLLQGLMKDESSIVFDFLNLDELNQTDELYVKMNARGKQLSEFEHFKAWLIHYVKENKLEIKVEDWKTKLDKDWLDLFWKNKGTEYSIDKTIYNFIKQIALFAYIQKPVEEFDLNFTTVVRESDYIPFSQYDKYKFFNTHTLNFVFKTLNYLSNNSLTSMHDVWLKDIACFPFLNEEVNLSKIFITNAKPVDRPLSVFYYAFILFVIENEEDIDEKAFKTWVRLSRNLVFNTYIQNPENYIVAIQGLYELMPKIWELITTNLDKVRTSNATVNFFGDKIFRNELYKLSLRKKNEEWNSLITQYENHEYFRGDIHLIMSYSFLNTGEYDFKSFKYYGDRLYKLFESEVRTSEEYMLQRALLCKGNYMPKVGSNLLFCLSNADSLRARRDNWQKVFNYEEGRNLIKKLIDEDLQNIDNIYSSLITTIVSYENNDWRKLFIKNPKVFEFCSKGFIRKNESSDSNTEMIYLLRTSKMYGKHAELRSYFFYSNFIKALNKFSPFKGKEYWENRMNQYQYPCIRFFDWSFQEKNYKLEVAYTIQDNYRIEILTEEQTESISELIINNCLSLNFKIDEEKKHLTYHTSTENELKNTLIDTLANLSKLL